MLCKIFYKICYSDPEMSKTISISDIGSCYLQDDATLSACATNQCHLEMLSFSRISEVEPKYYADGENAYEMKRDLSDLYEKVHH